MSRLRASSRLRAVLLLGALLALAPSVSHSQSLWLPRSTPRAVYLEVLHPNFDGVDEDILSVAGFLGFRGPIVGKTSIVLEVPFAHFSAESDDGFSLGKGYIGVEQGIGSTPLFLEVGARLPVLDVHDTNADVTGIVSDLNRWEAFFTDNFSLQLLVNARHATSAGLTVRGRVGPAVTLYDQFGTTQEDTYLLYAGQVVYEHPVARVGAAISARTLLFKNLGGFDEKTNSQADLHADFGKGNIRPGIDVKVPLDELDEVAPLVLGVSLGVLLPD